MEFQKGPDLAIDVAEKLNRRLLLAGPVTDREFFEESIEPRLSSSVRYVGVLDHGAKSALLATAGCVLMPSRIAESFGMVSVEAAASGAPVVALANGALAEIVEDGVTGFLTSAPDELSGLVEKCDDLDRAAIRAHALKRFDASTAARGTTISTSKCWGSDRGDR